VHVFGTNGSAEVLDEVTLVRRRSGTKPETINYPTVDVLANELAAFADAVERKQPFPIPQQEVLATLAAFDGALQSMQAGQSVPLGRQV
jgi:predicted dehydrogenase